EASSSRGGRWARLLDSRRRRRRRVAGVLAALGVAAVVVGLSWHPEASPEPKPQGARVSDAGGSVTVDTGKPATNGPGGVGTNPQKTGLPAVPPEGGKVRTGTKEEGC